MKRVGVAFGSVMGAFYMLNHQNMGYLSKSNQLSQFKQNYYLKMMQKSLLNMGRVNTWWDADGHAKLPYVGMSIRSLIDKPGMTVLLVNSESPAAKGGLKVGDIILQVNGTDVNRIDDYNKAMSGITQGHTIEIIIERYHERKSLSFRI